MYIAYTDEQEGLRKELRSYYERLLTPEVEAELAKSHGVGPALRRVVRQMGEDGWLGIGWPKEWGGQGRSAIEQFVFFDESMRAGAPVPMLTINTVGPTIM
ncbi:MAG TPA: acyl-CoA dehydrogenase family protein, partial [Acidimicrobiales bacterium]|nr:acyl-CoA dehydrogenase family protein [Acidimicrobiales bacterium]